MKSSDELLLRWGGRRSLRAAVLLSLLSCGAAFSAPRAWADSPGKAEAAAILAQFRSSIWQEATYAEFELREMPRRGPEHAFRGRFWGTRNERGPITRFEVDGPAGGFAHRILVQGGADSEIWTSDGPGPAKPGGGALLQPLVPGIELTPFDLLPMPYLYWLDADLVGVERVRGRTAYIYLLSPPADFAAANPGIKAVRAYLDAQYDALEQSEILRADGGVSKTLTLLELRKVGPRWIPKDMDVRNEATRDKTRLSLTAIGVGVPVAAATFDPQLLGSPAAPPQGDRVIRITP